jgi:hypothetical protein
MQQYGSENAEDNLASLISSTKPATKRQLHGEGVAADALLTDTDNGIGYGSENAEDNLASLITSIKGGAKTRRQLDKTANGLGAVLDAAGANDAAGVVVPLLDNVDGQTTDDAANIGTQVGGDEETILEQAGSDVPSHTRRQLDKTANGAGAVLDAAGANDAAGVVVPLLDNVDGQSTDDAANAGTQIGGDEETILEQAGSDVPSHTK